MLRSALALALLATFAGAQVPSDIPICAYRCAAQKIVEGYCSNQSIFVRAYATCMIDHCNIADRLSGLQFADSICALAQNAGITSGLPATATESANNALSSALAAAAPTISSQDPSSLSASVASETGAAATASGGPTSAASSAVPPSSTGSAGAPSSSGAAGGGGGNGGNSSYAAGALAALSGAGLTGLAGALTTAQPTQLLGELQQGNHTVFAPNNGAISALGGNASAATLTPLLSYHVLEGQVDPNSLQPGQHAIVRSSLRGQPNVNLPGNQSQVVVLSKSENGTLQVIETARNITPSGNTTFQNLNLQVINPALTIPGTLAATVGSVSDLSTLASTANSLSPELINQLGNISGITIFAPVNEAFSAAAQTLGGANQSTIQAVLLNHIVNGTALYSTLLAGSNATSAGGQPFQFTTNSTGTFVTSGNSTAQVVQSDIIVQNGVVHTINGVLANTASNPQAAEAAASSAAAEGAKQTGTQTGPVTPQETAGSAGGGGGSGTSSGSAPSASASNSAAFGLSAPVATVGGMLFGGFALALLA